MPHRGCSKKHRTYHRQDEDQLRCLPQSSSLPAPRWLPVAKNYKPLILFNQQYQRRLERRGKSMPPLQISNWTASVICVNSQRFRKTQREAWPQSNLRPPQGPQCSIKNIRNYPYWSLVLGFPSFHPKTQKTKKKQLVSNHCIVIKSLSL